MAHHAEELAVQRERHKQLTWKANIEVSSWSRFHFYSAVRHSAFPLYTLKKLKGKQRSLKSHDIRKRIVGSGNVKVNNNYASVEGIVIHRKSSKWITSH